MINLIIWVIGRIVLAVGGGIAVTAAIAGYVAILRGKTTLAGAKDLGEFVSWHWNDPDQAAAVLRTRAQLLSIALVPGLAGLSLGIFGPRFEVETLFLSCIALSVIAVWWWLEREFAWPGLFIPREARGTRGLFQARREARQAVQSERSGDQGARPDPKGGERES